MGKATDSRNRNESEIAGYRDVLNTIHESYEYIPISASYFLQLHRDLYKFVANNDGGNFKSSDNIIRKMDVKGNECVRFRPVPAWETAAAIDELCKAYADAKGEIDPLILNAMFILDFLCIHPFNDSNGRMSRLLTLLLLRKFGFVGTMSSAWRCGQRTLVNRIYLTQMRLDASIMIKKVLPIDG